MRHEPHEHLPRHDHEGPFLTLVVEGEYREICHGREDRCEAGMAVVHRDREEHEDRFGGSVSRLFNVLGVGHAGTLEWPVESRLVKGQSMERIIRLLDDELSLHDGSSGLVVDSLFAEMSVLATSEGWVRSDSAPGWMNQVVEQIRCEYLKPVSLDALACSAGVHKAHLAREFRRRHGTTVGGLVRSLRVEWAKVRLAQGSDISDVAFDAGFSDQSHFTRWFKRLTGWTPRSWAMR